MKMRSRRKLFALAIGLLLAPFLLLSAQPASAQRPYGGRGMYARSRPRSGNSESKRRTHQRILRRAIRNTTRSRPARRTRMEIKAAIRAETRIIQTAARLVRAALTRAANIPTAITAIAIAHRRILMARRGRGRTHHQMGTVGVNGQGQPKLPGQWEQRLGQMSPQQQEHFLQNNERFRSLPPDRQQQIRQNLQRYNSLSPAERDRVEHSYQNWQRMSPEQRQYVQRTLLPKWQQMSPDRKQVVTGRLHTLQQMSPADRQAALNDPRFMQGLSPRRTIRAARPRFRAQSFWSLIPRSFQKSAAFGRPAERKEPALPKFGGNPFTLLCCFGRFFRLGSHGSHPAPWQTPEVSHPDALDVRPGRYPHTGRGFFRY